MIKAALVSTSFKTNTKIMIQLKIIHQNVVKKSYMSVNTNDSNCLNALLNTSSVSQVMQKASGR